MCVNINIPINELYFDLLLDGQLSETAAVVAGMVGYNYYDFGDTPTLGWSMFLLKNFSRQIYKYFLWLEIFTGQIYQYFICGIIFSATKSTDKFDLYKFITIKSKPVKGKFNGKNCLLKI